MIMNVFGVILLVLNAYYVWKDVKNDTIRKVTLLNAAAVGGVFITLLHVL
jgi:hypothetical protein